MIEAFLLSIPVAGPFLAVTWRFFGTKVGQLALVAVIAFGSGVTLTTRHFWHKEAAQEAANKAALTAEHARRAEIIANAQSEALAANHAINDLAAQNDKLMKDSADASASNKDRPCLPSDAGVRLNAIGRPAK